MYGRTERPMAIPTSTQWQREFWRLLCALVLCCGLLDATAIYNTNTFGISVFVVASGIAGLSIVLSTAPDVRGTATLKYTHLVACILCLAIFWLIACVQLAMRVQADDKVFTQTMLRTLVIGHFIVCLTILKLVDDREYVKSVLFWCLLIYLSYGIYDFAAQIFQYPRFLDPLRNNASFFISRQTGTQGWIALPRLSSLAAEPSLTAMPVALSAYLAFQFRGPRRFLLIALCTLFVLGTFARSVWITMVGGTLLVVGMKVLKHWSRRSGLDPTKLALLILAICLPPIVMASSDFITPGPNADTSELIRVEASRAGIDMFLHHPLVGVGFEGWRGSAASFKGHVFGSAQIITEIDNGFSLYLASLGLLGIFAIYTPLFLILTQPRISVSATAWWVGIYCFSALNTDFISLASTWTALAVIMTLSSSGSIHENQASPATRLLENGRNRQT